MKTKTQYANLESTALRVVHHLAGVALNSFENLPPTEVKPDRSLVSAADREIESQAVQILSKETPGTGFYGEEFGLITSLGNSAESPSPLKAELGAKSLALGFHAGTNVNLSELWVLDPIDGTTNFLSLVPTWSILLAYVEDGEPVVGVVCFPALNLVMSASRGNGATYGPLFDNDSIALGQKPVKVCRGSSQTQLTSARVGYSSPSQFHYRGLAFLFGSLSFGCAEFRTHSDAFGYSLLLRGGIDAMVDIVAAPYDLAAIQVLINETEGLSFLTLTGESHGSVFSRGGAMAVCSPEIGQSLLESLKSSLDMTLPISRSLPQANTLISGVDCPQNSAMVGSFRARILQAYFASSQVQFPCQVWGRFHFSSAVEFSSLGVPTPSVETWKRAMGARTGKASAVVCKGGSGHSHSLDDYDLLVQVSELFAVHQVTLEKRSQSPSPFENGVALKYPLVFPCYHRGGGFDSAAWKQTQENLRGCFQSLPLKNLVVRLRRQVVRFGDALGCDVFLEWGTLEFFAKVGSAEGKRVLRSRFFDSAPTSMQLVTLFREAQLINDNG